MILREFPDIEWLKKKISEGFAEKTDSASKESVSKGWPTCILNVKSSTTSREDIQGPFSIFMNISGNSAVVAGGRQVSLNDNTFVLTNNEEPYSFYVPPGCKTETLNIHFGQQAFSGIFYALMKSDLHLLDQPEGDKAPGTLFPFRNGFRSETFNQLAQRLLREPGEEDSILMEIARLVAGDYCHEIRRAENLHTVKASTRTETLRRLYLATDFMHTLFDRPIIMDEVARACAMSKYHFLRSFKQAFGRSPYQYLKELRTRKALELICSTGESIQEICLRVGLENGSSLSRMIHQQTGEYPMRIRAGSKR